MRVPLCLSLLLITGCTTGLELSVDLRSDLVPGEEVDEAIVRWERSGQGLGERSVTIASGRDLAVGVRLVDLDGLGPGSYRAQVILRLAGADVADRSSEFELDGDLAITIEITRGCRDDECEPATCVSDADCSSSAACVRPTCAGGVCLDVRDDALCPDPCDADAGVCSSGEVEMGAPCGMCGHEERTCTTDCMEGPWTCVGEGECAAGATDTETRACATMCGGDETRTRSCGAGCVWGAWSAYGGCPPCGPICGDGMCETGETCASCEDCQAGHLGTGNDGDPCTGVPAETWRCVSRSDGARVSQVCRSGAWISFNLTPRDCNACVCSFSLSCCQTGSTSSGC